MAVWRRIEVRLPKLTATRNTQTSANIYPIRVLSTTFQRLHLLSGIRFRRSRLAVELEAGRREGWILTSFLTGNEPYNCNCHLANHGGFRQHLCFAIFDGWRLWSLDKRICRNLFENDSCGEENPQPLPPISCPALSLKGRLYGDLPTVAIIVC